MLYAINSTLTRIDNLASTAETSAAAWRDPRNGAQLSSYCNVGRRKFCLYVASCQPHLSHPPMMRVDLLRFGAAESLSEDPSPGNKALVPPTVRSRHSAPRSCHRRLIRSVPAGQNTGKFRLTGRLLQKFNLLPSLYLGPPLLNLVMYNRIFISTLVATRDLLSTFPTYDFAVKGARDSHDYFFVGKPEPVEGWCRAPSEPWYWRG